MNDVDGRTGVITYTQWLNKTGKLEADLTVTKLDDEKYFVVVTDTQLRHAETWMRRNIPEGAHVFVGAVKAGVVVKGSTPEQWHAFMASEYKKWSAVREKAGLEQR